MGGKGGFYGFKLYCPNGYSPTDPALMALYEYCERHGVPLTAHCSGGGFASFSPSITVHGHVYRNGEVVPHDGVLEFRHYRLTDKLRVKEKAELLNHPRLWEKVMEAFPRLRLNLAHFGCQDEGTEWTELIYGMMEKFPGLHTDLSCITETAKLREMREYFIKAPGTGAPQIPVRERFLSEPSFSGRDEGVHGELPEYVYGAGKAGADDGQSLRISGIVLTETGNAPENIRSV